MMPLNPRPQTRNPKPQTLTSNTKALKKLRPTAALALRASGFVEPLNYGLRVSGFRVYRGLGS